MPSEPEQTPQKLSAETLSLLTRGEFAATLGREPTERELDLWRRAKAARKAGRFARAPVARHSDYVARRNQTNEIQKRQRADARDVAPLPAVADPARREACRLDLRRFCETYFADAFELEWSPDHLTIIQKIERAALKGQLFAEAMPRGQGKTTLLLSAVDWIALYGHQKYIEIVGATEAAAVALLNAVKTDLESNVLLGLDFPEACHPIRRLERSGRLCAGQTFNGEHTDSEWGSSRIVLPYIPGSPSSGVVIATAGITGAIRGAQYKRRDGRTVRPSFVVIDDPQTAESAKSISQTEDRVRILTHDVLKLAGPNVDIAGVMACTVIQAGDMADQILDRKQHPEWQGEKMKLCYAFPKDWTDKDGKGLWRKYRELRDEQMALDGTHVRATEFYRAHRAEMDAGCRPAWEQRHGANEISAVEYIMNALFTDESAFYAEYQNEPLAETLGDDEQLTVDGVAHRLDNHERGEVPENATHLVAAIDVQKTLLYYEVCAFADDFTGYVVDYGAFPDQKRRKFALASATRTLQREFPDAGGLEPTLRAGLNALADALLSRAWRRRDGAELRIERCLVDANWGESTETVYQFARESVHAAVVLPCHGRYVGAASKPFSEVKKQQGERVGLNWRIPSVQGKRAARHVTFDSNWWKSFLRLRLLAPPGAKGAMLLYGRDPAAHAMFGEHLASEYSVRTEGRGRQVDEWKLRPNCHDNHFLDTSSACCVAASICGCALPAASGQKSAAKRKHYSLSEIQKEKRGY